MNKEQRNRLKHFEKQLAARKNNGVKAGKSCHKSGIVYRETPNYPSRTSAGNTERKDRPVYTGDQVIGIGTMHKSNLVPLTKETNDLRHMRR